MQLYIILDFAQSERQNGTEPPIVYTEKTIGTMFFEEEDAVLRYREIHACLKQSALAEQPSRDLLRQVARRYEQ
ncbi:Scr1 family TA system antitoxin-like transcriptional regulator [Nocardia jiangxiensis]|uniref:Scr1 family TA system antitoxin-like transcriptional regulator n=1 Tax=Nocardia jiangxiensis TaxID=282685 RepID=A0ABW6RWX1_9NOCA